MPQTTKNKILGYTIRFFAIIIWGIEPILGRHTSVVDLGITWRLTVILGSALITSLLIEWIRRALATHTTGKTASWQIPLNGTFMILLGSELAILFLFVTSLQYTSSTSFIILNNLGPIFALVIAVMFWRRELAYAQRASHLISIFGLFVLGSFGSSLLFVNDMASQNLPYSVLGNSLALGFLIFDIAFTIAHIRYVRQILPQQTIIINVYLYGLILPPFLIALLLIPMPQVGIDAYLWAALMGLLAAVGRWLNSEAFRLIDGFLAYLMFNLSVFLTFFIEAFWLAEITATHILVISALLVASASIGAEWINSHAEKHAK